MRVAHQHEGDGDEKEPRGAGSNGISRARPLRSIFRFMGSSLRIRESSLVPRSPEPQSDAIESIARGRRGLTKEGSGRRSCCHDHRARDRVVLPGSPDRPLLRARRGRPPDRADARRPRVGSRARSARAAEGTLGQRARRRARSPGPRRSFCTASRTSTTSTTSGMRGSIRFEFLPEPRWYGRRTVLRRRDEPDRRAPGQLSRHLRLERVPLLGRARLARLQVLHDRKERRGLRDQGQEGRGRRRGRPGRSRRVRLDLHALQYRLPLRGRRPASRRSTASGSASRSCGPFASGSAGSSECNACRSRAGSSASTTT